MARRLMDDVDQRGSENHPIPGSGFVYHDKVFFFASHSSRDAVVYHGCGCTAGMANGGGWHGRAGFYPASSYRKACDGSPEEMTPEIFCMGDDNATTECKNDSCP